MELRNPFNALHHFLANGGEQQLAATAPIVLPPNAPPQLANQVWTQVANNAIQVAGQPGLEVEFTIVNALVESVRVASEFRGRGGVSASRVAGGDVRLSVVEREARWIPA